MGSVSHVYTTGDNDPEIETERYFRHYLYCDACGSFDLEYWPNGDDADWQGKRRWLNKWVIIVTPILVLSMAWILQLSGVALWTLLGTSTLLVVGMLIARATASDDPFKGVRCRKCKATFAYGSMFFTHLDANPYGHSIGKVPRPLGRSLFLRGESV